MRAYSIVNGVIDNIIEVKSLNQFKDINLVDASGSKWEIGDIYANGKFDQKPEINVPQVVPKSVTKFQGKAALLQAGLLTAVIEIIENPGTDELVKMAWNDTNEFIRSSPSIENIGKSIGLNEKQIDDLFIAASKISI